MYRSSLSKMIFVIPVMLVTCVLFSASVRAAMTTTYYLDENNIGLDPDNFIRVTIGQNGNGDIAFDVEVLSDAFAPYLPGDNFGIDKFFFNSASSSPIGAQNIVFDNPVTWEVMSQKTAGSFGRYEVLLKGNGNSRSQRVAFSIVGIDGDDPIDYATGEPFFAAHIADISSTSRVSSGLFAGSVVVPLPASAILLGTGLIGLLGLRRSRSKG